MGLFDFMKNAGEKIFGNDDAADQTKPLSQHLRENGVDPSGIDFKFEGSTAILSGTVKDQDSREKAVLVAGNVDGIERVDDRLRVARAGADFGNVAASSDTVAGSAAGASGSVAHASAGSNGDWPSKTYTVESGDTLSGISKKMYGDAGKYQQIFQANQPMLKDPDRIYPGQVLRIPPEA